MSYLYQRRKTLCLGFTIEREVFVPASPKKGKSLSQLHQRGGNLCPGFTKEGQVFVLALLKTGKSLSQLYQRGGIFVLTYERREEVKAAGAGGFL